MSLQRRYIRGALASVLYGGAICLLAGGAARAQTSLESGQSSPVLVEPATGVQLLNGVRGYRIAIPPDTVSLLVRFENFTAATAVDLFVRGGTDVALNGSSVTADGSATGRAADKQVTVAPFGADTAYIALRVPAGTNRVVGRLTATVFRMFADGTPVTVPSIAHPMLAGAADGATYFYGQNSAPLSSPVSIPVTPGQALQITARGQVRNIVMTGNFLNFGGPWSPEGRERTDDFSGGMEGINGLSDFGGRIGALVGVFTGNTLNTRNKPWPYNFTNEAGLQAPVLRLQLQQLFHVGSGLLADGQPRTIVVPAGATRLHLGVAGGGLSGSSGNYRAMVRTVPVPPTSAPGNPVRLSSRSQLMLAGAPDGWSFGYINDVSPLHSPPSVPVTAGQTLRIRASGLVDSIGTGYSGGITCPFTPNGCFLSNGNGNFFDSWRGISGYRGAVGEVIGVFTGNTLNENATPPALNFMGQGFRNLTNVRPLLQQTFFIGTGVTEEGETKTYTVPAGATRLYLGIGGTTAQSSGEFYVTVSPDVPTAPKIAAGGFANSGGFGGAPFTPGSILSIFGSNFGPQQVAASTPLPVILGDTQVWFNAIPAPLYFVSPTQINVQIPPQLATATSAQVTVTRGGVPSEAQILELAPFRPGIFTAGQSAPILINAVTGALLTETAPAAPGDYLILYASGAGPVAPVATAGVSSPSAPLARALFPTEVVLQSGGREVAVDAAFLGLAPGFVGVFQLNFQLPPDLPPGTVQMRLQSAPAGASNTVTFTVRAR